MGLRALVVGLEAAKPSLERRILRDSRIGLSPAGRRDLLAGRVDVRVLVVIRYLGRQVPPGDRFMPGHRASVLCPPSVVSAHVDGLAVDISSSDGIPITGNQGIGGITEHTIKALLRLPVEVQPQQIISLLGLGGPASRRATTTTTSTSGSDMAVEAPPSAERRMKPGLVGRRRPPCHARRRRRGVQTVGGSSSAQGIAVLVGGFAIVYLAQSGLHGRFISPVGLIMLMMPSPST